MIKFDSEGRIQDFTFVLSLKNHDHLGQIRNIEPESVVAKINMNGANELSFTVYKYNEAEAARFAEKGMNEEEALEKTKEPLWDEITDFKYVYVKEIGDKGEYFEITVDSNDEESIYKTITGTSACEVELSQSYVYNLEINTEADIARIDYTSPTVFYDPLKPEASLLNRALYKLPQYSIKHVDASLMTIQRTFSADGTDVYSLLTGEVAEEIGCLFEFDSVDRSVSVYDLMTVCVDCQHRGEFSDVCPECGSTNLKYYGEDTTIYIDTENLAESVNVVVDTDSVKNCFKLEAGDDNMTAAVRNLNPNGSDYIYYFSEEQKHDMPDELVEKLESYDALVESYEEEYTQVSEEMYEAIDKIIYYNSGMMPTREDDPTNATLEAAKLTQENLSPLVLTDVKTSTSTATVNAALKEYAKVFIKSGYFKVEINEGSFSVEGTSEDGYYYGYWYGNFKVTNYSDEEDVATSTSIRVKVTGSKDDFEDYMLQKIKKQLALEDEEDGSIFDVLSIENLDKFKEALTYYGLNRLTSFYDAVQGCLDIMIEMDLGRENNDLHETMYLPYYNKLSACQEEIDKRQATIDEWGDKLDTAEQRRIEIQEALNFEAYLGTELYKVFAMYKREDKFSNENYISDGLENDEIFRRAEEFLEAAKTELVKSGEHQRSISSTLANLLCMEEFEPIKDKFKEGNFIRVGTDGKVYRLRLVSYQISFGGIQNIDVEFSDVTKIRTGMSDLQSVLSKASSMASTYGATTRQVKSSKEQTDFVKNFVANGFDATNVKIVNNARNENITITDSGLLARKKDEFYESYDDTQLKLMSTGVYVTDNNWRSTKSCIGKFYYTDPASGEQVEAYGLLAESIVGQIILGNELGIHSSDGSSEMTFDNFGLVLNAKGGEDGQYKRILDIQKDGVSQLYIDTDGNIVLATDQMIQTVEQLEQLNAYYANIEKLYVKEATVVELLAKYATIENLEAVDAKIQNLDVSKLEAEFANIKKLVATDAEIENLEAGNITVVGKLEAAEAEIENLEAVKVDVGELNAYKAEVEKLFADYAKIENLDAINANIENLVAKDAEIENLIADKVTVEQLNATNAKIENLEAEDATIKNLVAEKVDAEYVDAEIINASKIIVDELDGRYITVETLESEYAKIEMLESDYAKIETLESDYATIKYVDAEIVATEELIADKATVEDLNAAKADIGELNAQIANIESIMAGNIGAGLIQTMHLTAKNVVIDDAVVKDLIASKIDVSDLKAGSINTDQFTIQSDDGGIKIVGSTQQFTDSEGNVRLQAGKDAEGKFRFIVFGEDGSTAIYDENGITQKAVPDGLIVDKMVSDNASIQGKKLDIDSVITEINDNGTTTISSTKIWIDEENQSIGAKFDSITESVDDLGKTLSTKVSQTDFEVEQGKIQSLIKETETINTKITDIEGDVSTVTSDLSTLTDKYNTTAQTVEGNTTTIGNISTTVNNLTGEVESMDSRITTVEQTANGLTTTVSKVQADLDNLEIGGRNLLINTKTFEGFQKESSLVLETDEDGVGVITYPSKSTPLWHIVSTVPIKYSEVKDRKVTFSILVKCDEYESLNADTTHGLVFSMRVCNDSTMTSIKNRDKNYYNYELGAGWNKVSWTVDVNDSNFPSGNGDISTATRFYMSVFNYSIYEMSIKKFKLEYGDKATDWSPAEEDTENAIVETKTIAEQTSEKFNWIVKSGTNETNFTLTDRTATLVADNINLKGLVTFSGLSSDVNEQLEKVDNIKIGSTNLLLNSAFTENFNKWNVTGDAEITEIDGVKCTHITGEMGVNKNISQNIFDKINTDKLHQTYVYSADVRLDNFVSGTTNPFVKLYFSSHYDNNGVSTFMDATLVSGESNIVTYREQGWVRMTYVLKFDKIPTDLVVYVYARDFTGDLYFKNLKLEKGNIATEWNPAPEDNASQALIDAWVSDAIVEGTTTINGGYIKSNTIDTDHLVVDKIFATGSAVMNIIDARELNADMITSGTIKSNYIELYGLEVKHQTSGITTFAIDNNGEVTIRGGVESYNYSSGSSGWSINPDGNAEFNNVTVRGDLINTDGGISSETGITKTVRFWAGSSYEERESAPWIVYSDGSMVATKGTFGGVFTGEIEIGNISIIDPSKTSGNDAIVTIQHGGNGIKRVQLRDTESSDFTQAIKITDNAYNQVILLGQDGYGLFNGGVTVGNSTKSSVLSNDTLTLNGSTINGSVSGELDIIPTTLNIGTVSSKTNLNVYGSALLNDDVTFNGSIMIGNKLKITSKSNGVDIDFVE